MESFRKKIFRPEQEEIAAEILTEQDNITRLHDEQQGLLILRGESPADKLVGFAKSLINHTPTEMPKTDGEFLDRAERTLDQGVEEFRKMWSKSDHIEVEPTESFKALSKEWETLGTYSKKHPVESPLAELTQTSLENGCRQKLHEVIGGELDKSYEKITDLMPKLAAAGKTKEAGESASKPAQMPELSVSEGENQAASV
jgi:hypothetical protein